MQVIWSPASLRQIEQIHDYMARENPVAAMGMAELLHDAGRSLDSLPHRGRPMPNTRMRELIVRPYIVRYQVDGNRGLIVRVRHGARCPTKP